MDLAGKVCVITGATSGIGEVAAIAFARMGARLVLVARDRLRAEATIARLRAAGPEAAHAAHYADLSLMADTKRVAAEIAAREPRIDLLVNNAGALFSARQVTAEGLERHFALNHMAYFVLTEGLRERLFASAPARVINTASEAHRGAHIDFDDLQFAKEYNGVAGYRRSKLCNILWTRELARRWAGTGVTANCFHPGFVATRYGNEAGGLLAVAVRVLKLFALSPGEGATTLIYLASAAKIADASGGYFIRCQAARPTVEAENDETARRLWDESERLAARV